MLTDNGDVPGPAVIGASPHHGRRPASEPAAFFTHTDSKLHTSKTERFDIYVHIQMINTTIYIYIIYTYESLYVYIIYIY